MEQRRVLLIPSDDFGWGDLRRALGVLPDARIVGEVADAHMIPNAVQAARPDIVFSAAALAGVSIVPAIVALHHAATPVARFILFATRFDPGQLAALAAVDVADCLLWGDLGACTLTPCLTTLLAGTIAVSSREVVRVFRARRAPEGRRGPQSITQRERTVLQELAAGRTQEQIADHQHLSVRTVKRIVAGLQEKMDAPCQFALGKRAAELGFVS